MGALGAALFGVSVMTLAFCGLGAVERARWNGKVPSIGEYMSSPTEPTRRSSILQLRAATFGRRTLLAAFATCVLGIVLTSVDAIR